MRVLEGNALQEYIQNAITVETDIATQERIITEYRENALSRKPVLLLKELPNKPKTPYYIAPIMNDGKNINLGTLMSLIVGGSSLFFGLVALMANGGMEDIDGLLVILFLVGIGLMLPYFSKKKEAEEINAQKEKNYQNSLAYYEEQVERINGQNEMIRKQQSANIEIWDKANQVMEQKFIHALEETQMTLNTLYSQDVIYAKYRNLPALTSIYEYLITGRCEGLTGPHGAYNLYEDEVRKDIVISQLSVVIENLEQIKQNQYMLYQQVKEIQKTTDSIESELRQIKGYTVQLASLSALNAYYAALTERNTRITMWCNI